MTAQISDRFIYRDEDYSLAGVSGKGLFQPDQFGIEIEATCSACWRGFMATYQVWEDTNASTEEAPPRTILRLIEAAISPKDLHTLPLLLFGAPLEPMRPESAAGQDDNTFDFYGSMFSHAYRNCPEPVSFTGGILLARGFIEELYEHMGFHPAWKYREVHELVFNDGVLIEAHDRSEPVARVRDKQSGSRPGFTSREDHLAWIADTFSMRYDRGELD